METKHESNKYKIIEHIRRLIDTPPNAGKNKKTINILSNLFAAISGISANEDMNNWNDINLSNGVAISPVQAAKCLQETIRTQVFLQGIMQAIKDKLARHGNVNILYAGTGPYGLLILPLLCLLNNKKISVTLLDIHEKNIQSITRVIESLNLSGFIKNTITTDATSWTPNEGEKYDMIVSETMNTLLRREPQLSIFCHLQQYLKDDGLLIPEKITIGAELVNAESETQKRNTPSIDDSDLEFPPIKMKNFFQCNKQSVKEIYSGNNACLKGKIPLPKKIISSKYSSLKFTTTIDVYKQHQLGENQCSLNMPVYYHNLKLSEGEEIDYEYQLSNNPEFTFRFPIKTLDLGLPATQEKGNLGLIHLKRLWKKMQLDRVNKLDKKIIQAEWELDLHLLNQLQLTTDETLCYLYQQQPCFLEFEQWLATRIPESILHEPQQLNRKLLKFYSEITG